MPAYPDERSAMRSLLRELVKAALVSDPGLIAAAREKGLAAHAALGGAVGTAPDVWSAAVNEAEADPDVLREEDVNPILPTTCPLERSMLERADFDFDAAARVIRESASFG